VADRWLYQGLAEPPPAAVLAAETVTVDKWFRQPSEPVCQIGPYPESDLVRPIDLSAIPIPGDGAWIQPQSQPLLPPRAIEPLGGDYVTDPTVFEIETVTLDKWFRQPSEPVLPVPPCLEGYLVRPIDLSDIPIPGDGAWLQPISQPLLPREAVQPLSGEYIADPTVFEIETVTLDKWFQAASEPVWRIPPHWPGHSQTISEPTLFEIPPLNTWFRPLSEPVFPWPPRPYGGCVYQGSPDDFVATATASHPYEVVATGSYMSGAVAADDHQAGAVAAEGQPT